MNRILVALMALILATAFTTPSFAADLTGTKVAGPSGSGGEKPPP